LMPPIQKTFRCRGLIFFGDFLTPDFLAGPSQDIQKKIILPIARRIGKSFMCLFFSDSLAMK